MKANLVFVLSLVFMTHAFEAAAQSGALDLRSEWANPVQEIGQRDAQTQPTGRCYSAGACFVAWLDGVTENQCRAAGGTSWYSSTRGCVLF